MKVIVTIPLDIDVVEWGRNYGVYGTAAVRADVKAYVANGVTERLRDMGLLVEEEPS